jgi:maltose O-acetyltransferase
MNAYFDTRKNFYIGNNSVLNQKCRIDNRGGITIGNNVSISAEVCILTADHDLQCSYCTGRSRPVVIEDYVFIGTRAMILPGVSLGRGSAVAAGAVVTRDVPPYTVVAGVPARPISNRPTDLRYTVNYGRLFS